MWESSGSSSGRRVHEVLDKLLTRVATIWTLNWGWKTQLPTTHMVVGMLVAQLLLMISHFLELGPLLSIAQIIASPTVNDLKRVTEERAPSRQKLQCYHLTRKLHSITFAKCYLLHKLTLHKGNYLHKSDSSRRHDSQRISFTNWQPHTDWVNQCSLSFFE